MPFTSFRLYLIKSKQNVLLSNLTPRSYTYKIVRKWEKVTYLYYIILVNVKIKIKL